MDPKPVEEAALGEGEVAFAHGLDPAAQQVADQERVAVAVATHRARLVLEGPGAREGEHVDRAGVDVEVVRVAALPGVRRVGRGV